MVYEKVLMTSNASLIKACRIVEMCLYMPPFRVIYLEFFSNREHPYSSRTWREYFICFLPCLFLRVWFTDCNIIFMICVRKHKDLFIFQNFSSKKKYKAFLHNLNIKVELCDLINSVITNSKPVLLYWIGNNCN